ncbi:MAG: MFS transporter [Anaerolineae bacterium]|nr:MFS transporter [Anaerolineae bacterium]
METAAAQPVEAKGTAPPKGRWYTVFAFSVAYLIDSMEGYTTQMLWPYIYPVLGIPVASLAVLQSLGKVVAGLTGPIWGYIADRVSRKWLLVIMTGMWGLWTSAKGFANTFSQLLAFSILAGLGLTVLEAAALSVLSDLFDRKQRGRAIGFMIGAGFAGSAISVLVLGTIAETNAEAWRIGFIVMGVLSFLSGLLLLGIRERPRGSAEPEISDVVTEETAPTIELRLIPRLLQIRSWWLILLNEVLDFIGFSAMISWAFTWMAQLGYGSRVQLALLAQMAGTVIGHFSFGWMSDYFDQRSPRFARVAIGQIALVVNAAAAAGFLILGAQQFVYLFLFGLLFGLTFALKGTGSRLPIQTNVVPPELRATGRSLVSWSVTLVTAGSLAFSGWLLNRLGEDLQRMMLLMVPLPLALSALAWIAMFWAYPRDMRALEAQLSDLRADIVAAKE